MKRLACSYCNGEGEIKVVREEALEQALADLLQLNHEPYQIESRPCSWCDGRGTKNAVELRDFCRIHSR